MSTSPKRNQANQSNAQHSTGPRTPEGKTRSAQNAHKHAFTAAKFTVVRIEDVAEVEQLRERAIATYQPVNSQELFAIERVAIAQHSLVRISYLEAGLFTNILDDAMEGPARPFILERPEIEDGIQVALEQHRAYWIASGFRRVAQQDKVIALFLRYQAQAERLYRRAVEEFERLKALRPELPVEPTIEIPNEPIDAPEIAEPTPESPGKRPPQRQTPPQISPHAVISHPERPIRGPAT